MTSEKSRIRERLAYRAARIMAQDGIDDFGVAKRKAARLEGVPDTRHLPANEEIERELRLQRELFTRDEHHRVLRELRTEALNAMRWLKPFNPRLIGPIVTGTAGKYSEIRLQLFADDSKEVEIFLINENIRYQADEARVGDERQLRPRLKFAFGAAAVSATILLPHEVRRSYKSETQQPVPVEWLEAELKQT
ncbi:MAG: UDP-N-acetylmuramate--alanine ligase [Burkholderiales bacterium]